MDKIKGICILQESFFRLLKELCVIIGAEFVTYDVKGLGSIVSRNNGAVTIYTQPSASFSAPME